MKKTLLLILTCVFSMLGVAGIVKADTNKCTAEMKSEILKSVSSVNASYEFVYDDNGKVKGFNISVYNVPDNMSVVYSVKDSKFKKDDSFDIENGKGSIFDGNLTDIYTYHIDVYSLKEGCSYKVKTFKVIKPKRNSYSELVYCQYDENVKSTYCQEWITREINKEQKEVEELLQKN